MLGLDPGILPVVVTVTLVAGFVKGAVGFAMPMIMISGLASVLPVEQALAFLILPTLATNGFQAFRQGWRAAWATLRSWWRLVLSVSLFIALSSQLLPLISQRILLVTLGVPIVAFAISQLAGRPWRFGAANRPRAEWLAGAVGGFFGGLSGVWGPPTVALMLSLDVEKRESLRVQGVVYLIGAVALLGGHLRSGVVNAQTLPLSALLVVPALVGLSFGFRAHDRLDAARFRRWTLVVLVIAGLNLLRRAYFL